jgi:hypothetical protein
VDAAARGLYQVLVAARHALHDEAGALALGATRCIRNTLAGRFSEVRVATGDALGDDAGVLAGPATGRVNATARRLDEVFVAARNALQYATRALAFGAAVERGGSIGDEHCRHESERRERGHSDGWT